MLDNIYFHVIFEGEMPSLDLLSIRLSNYLLFLYLLPNIVSFCADNGMVFTCGDGLFGQLGHGDYESKCSPLEVLYFSSKHVEQVACGMRHTLALLKGNFLGTFVFILHFDF